MIAPKDKFCGFCGRLRDAAGFSVSGGRAACCGPCSESRSIGKNATPEERDRFGREITKHNKSRDAGRARAMNQAIKEGKE